jgi:drug/metabolite transporter (DMT)-like permease
MLSTVGLQYLGPGRSAVLINAMPLWALPLGWLIAHDRVSVKSVIGCLTGICGLLIFMNPQLVNWHDPRTLWGNALVLSSGIGWAVGASLYRRRKWQSPLWTQTTWQVLCGAVVVTSADLFAAHHRVQWYPVLIGVLLFSWIIATSLCYWLWGRALAIMPASRAGQIVSLVPVLALLMGAAWNGERLTPLIFVSMALIFTGIVITIGGRQSAPATVPQDETASLPENG